jgi:hypothetical protein
MPRLPIPKSLLVVKGGHYSVCFEAFAEVSQAAIEFFSSHLKVKS